MKTEIDICELLMDDKTDLECKETESQIVTLSCFNL